MAYNIGDQMIVEATITPDTSTPVAAPTVVVCTFTKPTGVTVDVAMTNVSGTLWRCTGPTFDVIGSWIYRALASTGLQAAESAKVTVNC